MVAEEIKGAAGSSSSSASKPKEVGHRHQHLTNLSISLLIKSSVVFSQAELN
jgi:hypothetical protein